MSDMFLQFSTSIDNLTKEEVEWIDEHLGLIESWNENELDEDSEEYARLTHLAGIYGFEDECDTLAFEWQYQDSDSGGKRFLWIYADCQGNPDHVIAFAQEFLLANRPKGSFSFSWSVTCSQPIVNEFGGGAAFVTALSAECIDTWTWCRQKWQASEKETKQ